MEIPEYRIATMADMLGVPADRRSEMLIDLATWLELMGVDHALKFSDGEVFPLKMEPVFIWLDDGLRDVQRFYLGDNCYKLTEEPIPYEVTDAGKAALGVRE